VRRASRQRSCAVPSDTLPRELTPSRTSHPRHDLRPQSALFLNAGVVGSNPAGRTTSAAFLHLLSARRITL
jgi:hypothetical protein